MFLPPCPRVLLGRRLSEHPGLKEACQDLYSRQIRSPFLLAMLVDIYEEEEAGEGRGQESLGQALEVRTTW